MAINLRWFIFLSLLLTSVMLNAKISFDGKYLVYVGTYTANNSPGFHADNSFGIYAYRFNTATGTLVSLGLAAKNDSPAFLALAKNNKFLYAANETSDFKKQPSGSVSAFSIDGITGKLSLLNQVSAHDVGPTYISMDRTGKYVLIANYPLGSVTVFPVLKDGKLGETSDFVRHKGSSINKVRQEGPHAHAHAIELSPDNRFAIVADLGIDQLLIYPFDANNGKLGHPKITKIAPGSGPRHLSFSPNGKFLYLINELKGTITVFSYGTEHGTLHKLQTVSSLPIGYKGQIHSAEIAVHPSGKFLYASNRIDHSIAIFCIDKTTGKLRLIGHISTKGKTPRHFALDPSGRWLLAANQDSDNIVIFKINVQTGQLTQWGKPMRSPVPVSIVFVPD